MPYLAAIPVGVDGAVVVAPLLIAPLVGLRVKPVMLAELLFDV